MVKNNTLIPPKETSLEKIDSLIQAAISEFPGMSIGIALVNFISVPSFSIRLDNWREEVGSTLIDLAKKYDDFNIESLASNEMFISTLAQTMQASLKTHQIEKRTALRNALLNVAISPDVDETEIEILIGIIDSLSTWHIKLLDLLADPKSWSKRHNIKIDILAISSSKNIVITEAYPDLKNKREFYDPIVLDLFNKGLIRFNSAHTLLSKEGALSPGSTDWGNKLVLLISEPKELFK